MFHVKLHMKIGEPVVGFMDLPNLAETNEDFKKNLLIWATDDQSNGANSKVVPFVNVNWVECLT